MAREQFTFYRSFFKAASSLRKAADRLSIYEAIVSYALDGTETPRTDAADALFVLIKPVLDSAARKSQGGKTPSRKQQDTEKMQASNAEDADNNKKDKVKDKVKVKNKCLEIPPAREDVERYVLENGYRVNVERWFAHYESNGWKVGRDRMKDWKASIRYWNSTDKQQVKSFADMWREEQ